MLRGSIIATKNHIILVQVKKTYSSGTIKNHVKNKKQPPEVLCENRCSEKFREIHRKAPVPGSLTERFWPTASKGMNSGISCK